MYCTQYTTEISVDESKTPKTACNLRFSTYNKFTIIKVYTNLILELLNEITIQHHGVYTDLLLKMCSKKNENENLCIQFFCIIYNKNVNLSSLDFSRYTNVNAKKKIFFCVT